MAKVEELIDKLCPNGVKYYMLGELEDNNILKLGRGNVISKDEIRNTPGDFPVYSSSSVGDGEIGRYGKYMFDDERITWSIDGGGKFFYRNNLKYSVTNVGGWIKVLDDKILNTKFLYYSLINSWATQDYNYTKKAHPSVIRNEYRIPVPPMEIQREIVKVLDDFTAVTLEISSALSSEIVARKKQYEFYKDELYSFKDKNVEYVKLKDIAEIIRGGNFQKKDFVENGRPCIHYGQIYTRYGASANTTFTFVSDEVFNKSKQAKPNDIVMAVTSENVEDVCKCVVWCGNENIAVSGHTAIIHHNINAKYLGYYFSTSHFYNDKVKLVHGTKVMEVTPSSLNEVLIPLPTPKEQERIAKLVENYDKICSEFISKIPAEIEKRQKQYDFYRDKLLNFKEAEVNE